MASLDIGIDLGTSSMATGNVKNGIILNEPSLIALDARTKKVIGIGDNVKNIRGRESGNIEVHSPLLDGVIYNYNLTRLLVDHLLRVSGKSMIFKPRVISCVPCGSTNLEAQSIMDVILEAGARSITLVQEPVAAALGAGIDITKPNGTLLVDIGGGTTDAAVISLGGIVCSESVKIAGNAIDEAIQRYIRDEYNVVIGLHTAENVKKDIMCFWKKEENITSEVKGRGVVSGLPTQITVGSHDLFPIVDEISFSIVQCIQAALEQCPPELAGDISQNGICLTGGSARLSGIERMLEEAIRVPVYIPEVPDNCAILGALKSFEFLGEDFSGFYSPHAVEF